MLKVNARTDRSGHLAGAIDPASGGRGGVGAHAEPSTTKWVISICGAPGASVAASTRQCGVDSCQGAENAALKNTAPCNRTPLKTSENASIFLPDAGQTFPAPAQSHSSPWTIGQELQPSGHGLPVNGPAESLA